MLLIELLLDPMQAPIIGGPPRAETALLTDSLKFQKIEPRPRWIAVHKIVRPGNCENDCSSHQTINIRFDRETTA